WGKGWLTSPVALAVGRTVLPTMPRMACRRKPKSFGKRPFRRVGRPLSNAKGVDRSRPGRTFGWRVNLARFQAGGLKAHGREILKRPTVREPTNPVNHFSLFRRSRRNMVPESGVAVTEGR